MQIYCRTIKNCNMLFTADTAAIFSNTADTAAGNKMLHRSTAKALMAFTADTAAKFYNIAKNVIRGKIISCNAQTRTRV